MVLLSKQMLPVILYCGIFCEVIVFFIMFKFNEVTEETLQWIHSLIPKISLDFSYLHHWHSRDLVVLVGCSTLLASISRVQPLILNIASTFVSVIRSAWIIWPISLIIPWVCNHRSGDRGRMVAVFGSWHHFRCFVGWPVLWFH